MILQEHKKVKIQIQYVQKCTKQVQVQNKYKYKTSTKMYRKMKLEISQPKYYYEIFDLFQFWCYKCLSKDEKAKV